MPAMIDLIDRAARDPDLLARLQKDPFGAAKAEGFDVSRDDVRALLGMHGATDAELTEALQQRLSYTSFSDKLATLIGTDAGGGLMHP